MNYRALLPVALCLASLPLFAQGASNPALEVEHRLVKATPLPLNSVCLTGGPLKTAQDLELKYLLELEPDRMLAYLRRSAGLKAKAKGYGGWDGDGRQLTGHIVGHYLSAVSLAWAATGDKRFLARERYIVSELAAIQKAQGDGYLGALQDEKGVDGKKKFEELSRGVIHSGGFDLNGLWSPWYVEHKIFAGLRDAYRYADDAQALEVEVKFAGWAEKILAPLSDEQLQKMLATEFGGMNETLADLYADTTDARWLKLARKFDHKAVIDPLAAGKDILGGHHANTQMPKMYGELKLYLYTGDEREGRAASFFWDEVATRHSFSTGGDSRNEYFGEPGKLSPMTEGRTAETCNVYNMIKMARTLFSLTPEARYADYHERALFNQILASQDTTDGRVSYMTPVGRGVQHEYQDKFDSFTCCVGSAMESHALHGYGIYYESGDKLWVSLYAPTTATWAARGVKLETATSFPLGETATITVKEATGRKLTLALRRPQWAGEGFTVKINGEAVSELPEADHYVELAREWKAGDTIEVRLPKRLHVEALPDNHNRLSVLWGPLVLAGDIGPEMDYAELDRMGGQKNDDVPTLVTNEPVEKWLQLVDAATGRFRTKGLGLQKEIDFVPFYELPRRRYAIYWDVFTPTEWSAQKAAYELEAARKQKLEAATVAFAQPGQMQTERDFNQHGEQSEPVQRDNRYGRYARGWFSFDLPIEAGKEMTLVVTYGEFGGSGACEVLVDGEKVGAQKTESRSPEQDARYFDVEYKLPSALTAGKKKVTIRFNASEGRPTPAVVGLRMTRGENK